MVKEFNVPDGWWKKRTGNLQNITVYRCGNMHCYKSNKDPRFGCIDVKYRVLVDSHEFKLFRHNLCNVDTILAFLPQDTYKCGDPSFKERYPLQIYWA